LFKDLREVSRRVGRSKFDMRLMLRGEKWTEGLEDGKKSLTELLFSPHNVDLRNGQVTLAKSTTTVYKPVRGGSELEQAFMMNRDRQHSQRNTSFNVDDLDQHE